MKFSSYSVLYFFFGRKIRSRKRGIMRGYRELKKSGNQAKIADLKRLLSDNKLEICPQKISSFVVGDHISNTDKELCLRQYLLLRCGAYKLNEALLLEKSNKNKCVIYPIPSQWRKLIEGNGFQVAHRRSELLWNIYLLLLVGYGCMTAMKIVFRSIVNLINDTSPKEPHVYFVNLTYGNFPKFKEGKQSYDILSWYIRHFSKNSNWRLIRHDIGGVATTKVQDIKIEKSDCGPIPNLSELQNILKFSCWSFFSALFSLMDLVRGRWWHALIFNEAVLAKKASMTKPENVAKQYLFHQTGQTYRPLWTYIVENHGAKVVLYFYSINIQNISIDPTYFWRCMTWPKYLVWNSCQADFVRRCIGIKSDVEIQIVNSIWFNDEGRVKLPTDSRSIAIFDVTPHRHFQYCGYADDNEYVVPETCITFVQDIRDVATKENFTCWYKAKRDIGKRAHPSYRRLLRKMFVGPNVSIIDPGTSPYDLIPSCTLVICLPFTAPAIIARELGIPACYYDPTNTISKNHPAAHGITIIGNKKMLLSWVKEQSTC